VCAASASLHAYDPTGLTRSQSLGDAKEDNGIFCTSKVPKKSFLFSILCTPNSARQIKMSKQHVAVIGAGMAGLSCATALQQAGHSVRIFDKSRGVGGRLSTRRADGWVCDHGAQFFTVKDEGFSKQVAEWEKAGVAGQWSPRIKVLNADAHGNHWSDPKGETTRFVGLPGMSAPTRALSESLDVRTGTTINGMFATTKGWQLHSAEHGMLPRQFSRVVLAAPPVQSAAILGSSSEMLTGIATSIAMQPCWTVMLQFKQKQVELPFDAAFVNAGPLSWIARNSSKPGRAGLESWILHSTPAWATVHVESNVADVGPLLIKAFTDLGGAAPSLWSAHRWRYASSDTSVSLNSAWDAANGLGLCGDWLNGGRVEGAWLSGQHLAQRMLSEHRK